jgi:hypothetical protein
MNVTQPEDRREAMQPHPIELLHPKHPPGRALKLVLVYIVLAAVAWILVRT